MKNIELIKAGLAIYQHKNTLAIGKPESVYSNKLVHIYNPSNVWSNGKQAMKNEIKIDLAHTQNALKLFEESLSDKNLTQVEKIISINSDYLPSVKKIRDVIIDCKKENNYPQQDDIKVGVTCNTKFLYGHKEKILNVDLEVEYLPFPYYDLGKGYESIEEHYDAIIGAFDELMDFINKCINHPRNNPNTGLKILHSSGWVENFTDNKKDLDKSKNRQ